MTRRTPYVPRPIDLPTAVPLDPDADLSVLDEAKIFAAPDDPADWPAWRAALARWRAEARRADRRTTAGATTAIDRPLPHRRPGLAVGRDALRPRARPVHRRRVPRRGRPGLRRLRRRGALARVPGHRDRRPRPVRLLPRVFPSCPRWWRAFQRRGVKVFVTYYPWDGPARTASDAEPSTVAWLDADGVFLDTLKEGAGELRDRARRRAAGPAAGRRVEGAAGPDPRPRDVVGAVVRRLRSRPGCCGPSGSSGGTCCTTPGAGTATTSTSCTRPGSTAPGCWCGRTCSASGSAGASATGRCCARCGRVQRSHARVAARRGLDAARRRGSGRPRCTRPAGSTTDSHCGRWSTAGRRTTGRGWTVDAGGPVRTTWSPAAELTVEPRADGRVAVGGPLPAGGIAAVVAGAGAPARPHPAVDGDPSFPARVVVRRAPAAAPAHRTPPPGWRRWAPARTS